MIDSINDRLVAVTMGVLALIALFKVVERKEHKGLDRLLLVVTVIMLVAVAGWVWLRR